MNFREIDPERWQRIWAADLDVLRSLAESGDNPTIPRLIDVSFRGQQSALDLLAAAAENWGFEVQERDKSHDVEPWLFLERIQPADADSIRELTVTYLQIEDTFEVECDGWGCVAQTDGKA